MKGEPLETWKEEESNLFYENIKQYVEGYMKVSSKMIHLGRNKRRF